MRECSYQFIFSIQFQPNFTALPTPTVRLPVSTSTSPSHLRPAASVGSTIQLVKSQPHPIQFDTRIRIRTHPSPCRSPSSAPASPRAKATSSTFVNVSRSPKRDPPPPPHPYPISSDAIYPPSPPSMNASRPPVPLWPPTLCRRSPAVGTRG